MRYKRYTILVIFNGSKLIRKLNRKNEIELKQIQNEIKILNNKQRRLVKEWKI